MAYEVYYLPGCEAQVLNPNCDPCPDKEKGRIRSVAFIHKDYYDALMVDPTDPLLWTAGIEAGFIKIVPETTGSTDGGAENEGAGYGDNSSELLGYDHTLEFQDPNYVNNCSFYDTIKKSRSFHVAYRTESVTHISSKTVTVIPKNPVTEDLETDVTWTVTVKWFQEDLVCPHTTPASIFECFGLAPA